jgi:hypothetical protein
VVGVVREDQHAPVGHVGGDHPQAVAVARILGLLVHHLPEARDALRREEVADPFPEVLALVDALVAQQAHSLAGRPEPVLPVLVLELGEGQVQQDLVELGRGVAGSDERRRDRAGRRPGHSLGGEAALTQRGERAGEADALYPAALEDQVSVLLLVRHAGQNDSLNPPQQPEVIDAEGQAR